MTVPFKFGWVRGNPDHRDDGFMYAAGFETLRYLPHSVDLRETMPPVYDQGRIGSCTANAIAGAIEYGRSKMKETPDWIPSRLFVYYNERMVERSIPLDAGAVIRDGIKVCHKYGVAPEGLWPYDDTPADSDGRFPLGSLATLRPTQDVYKEALKHQIVSYHTVRQNLAQIKAALADGYPVVFGFTVYESFFDSLGVPLTKIPLPGRDENVLGGHAVVIVGYDDTATEFIIRNSWGVGVQEAGYFYMDYAYVQDPNLAADFWIIKTIEA